MNLLKYRFELGMTAAAALALAYTAPKIFVANAAAQAGSGAASADGEETPPPTIYQLREGRLVPTTLTRYRHQFRVGYQPGFNVSAEFSNLGFSTSMVPGPGAGLVDRNYNDGFVRLETTGLAAGSPDGYTSYWSYNDASQVVGSSLLMHQAASSGTIGSSGSVTDDPQQGLEFSYAFEVGPVGRFYWGLEGTFSYTSIDIMDRRPLRSDVTLITDTYDISNLDAGGGPPPAPGTPSTGRSGTSALILVEPASRSVSTLSNSTIAGHRAVDASIYDFQLGPYVEFMISRNIGVALSGGLDLALVDSAFGFQETLMLPGSAPLFRSGSASDSDVLVGGYLAGRVSYYMNDSWNLYCRGQYRNLGTFSQTSNNTGMKLDLGSSIFATVGVGYSF